MPDHIKHWRRRAWFWSFITASIVITYECLAWAATFQANPGVNWNSTHSLNAVPVPAHLWQGAIVGVCFDTIPFIISQQVYVSFMVLTMMVADGLKYTNRLVKEEAKSIRGIQVEKNTDELGQSEGTRVTPRRKQMERAVALHYDAVKMCEELSDQFGWIFFFAHCFDLGCALGGLAQMIAPGKLTSLQWVNAAVRTLAFLGYCTLMQLPQIRVNLLSLDLVDSLCLYMGNALPVLQSRQGYRLWVVIQIFYRMTKEQIAVINGGEVVKATRKLFITTVTVSFSFAVLAHDVFVKIRDDNEEGNSTGSAITGILTGTSMNDE